MPTNDEDRVLEILDELECRQLLASAHLGRLGFTDGALPAIVPVPFAIAEDSLVIPARPGNWVAAAMRGSVVAVGVDTYDVDARTGWGVTAIGPSRVVPTAPAPTDPAGSAGTPARCAIVVQVVLLRGWRLSLPAVAAPDQRGAGAPVG